MGKTVLMRRLVEECPGRTMLMNGEDYDTLALLDNRTAANYRRLLEGMDLLAITVSILSDGGQILKVSNLYKSLYFSVL